MSDFRVAPARLDGKGYSILEDAALDGRNTLRVAARAALLVDVRDSAALAEVLAFPLLKSSPLLVLGEGSNLLLTRDVAGAVLSLATRGIRVVDETADHAIVRAEAGESWNDLVHWSLGHGLSGLENLVLIPGTAGAAPIQNIGAYGVELREFVHAVEAWDRKSATFIRFDNEQCGFGYRDSRFKRERERHIVTALELKLPRQPALRLDYAGVREELATLGEGEATPSRVAEAISRLRRRKLPDPAVIGNAGSFFKNPVASAPQADALRAAHPGMPQWPLPNGEVKLSAAWLIEAAGFKGVREGDAGIAAQHALVLVNHGRASGAQLWALAQKVQAGVAQRFGVMLEPEPRVV
ncbi:UDP-N-acetylmuramate dehydrogenase [Tahibacter aquaticus]|jgi:UDP-N-acetylmuramate dehydrogenase|uniref:UDP-N-acetylenolpyruvoylglucosamine reductase n=1 Tax=Tahibacter aquaticus TaxID=520092 RepID=A0A4R6YT85_9GAMM|nr:UDP-N-acetylmuramate dehydrogenase [Tahibacter aquaticus]TDR41599.1 UDP-N-acetylmuramate dehydrogenase [Tahibacter aquaticus]